MSYRISKSIVATVTYYDVMSLPLTAFEIWKHLIAYGNAESSTHQSASLGEVCLALASSELSGKLSEFHGFYFLPGREHLVAERMRTERISVSKLKRMRSLASVLSCLPYVRMVGATGSLAMKKGNRGSDWDMFIVLRSGKIWIGRTVLTLFLHLIGKRRHGDRINDRACLNY